MADQFLQMYLAGTIPTEDEIVIFASHILPIGKSTRTRAASVYEWTPLGKNKPGSAEGLGVGPLQWRISGPIVLGSYQNPKMLPIEGLRRWAMVEQWVGQDLVLDFGSFDYGIWIIKDVSMDGDIIAPIPEYDGAGAVENWWHSYIRHQWRINLVQKTPPISNPDFPALLGGMISVETGPVIEPPIDTGVDT